MNQRITTSPASQTSFHNKANQEEWRKIDPNTIVTRDAEGKPLSFFFENSWCIAPYKENSRHRNLHFHLVTQENSSPKLSEETRYQEKQTIYLLMHIFYDEVPAPETLRGKIAIVRDFSKFLVKQGLTLYEGFSDFGSIVRFIEHFPSKRQREKKSKKLHALLVSLSRLGFDRTGVQIPLKKAHGFLEQHMNPRSPQMQHPVIPTDIYHHILETCESELKKLESSSTSIFKLLDSMYSSHFSLNLIEPKIEKLLEIYKISPSHQGIHKFYTAIRVLCQIIILAFTGMRVDEVRSLPFNCLTSGHQDGVERFIVEGKTTKLTGGREKRARWVTSHLAARAIRFAQQFSKIVHEKNGVHDYETPGNSRCLLFCQTGLANSKYHSNRSFPEKSIYLLEFCQRAVLSISAKDIEELKNIDPLRAWDSEAQFAIGAKWPFTRHQLRRSLALYAHRSGLVSLPSLKRQLQHITLEMSMYYAGGSAFAKDFIGNNRRHFAHQWRGSEGLSEYLGYASKVLFNDERLFGAHASWAKSEAVKQSPVSVYSREEAIVMFKKGEIAFKETALGGCTSVERCKSLPVDWLSLECLGGDCKSLVVIPSKLQRVIKAQSSLVERLRKDDDDSVEYRIEAHTLDVLINAQRRFSRNP